MFRSIRLVCLYPNVWKQCLSYMPPLPTYISRRCAGLLDLLPNTISLDYHDTNSKNRPMDIHLDTYHYLCCSCSPRTIHRRIIRTSRKVLRYHPLTIHRIYLALHQGFLFLLLRVYFLRSFRIVRFRGSCHRMSLYRLANQGHRRVGYWCKL